MAKINYNERSWAIDVISEINLILQNKGWHFMSAGGESTIINDKSSLFPDVLIFKDKSKDIILQGWELKMPDTQINDAELIGNAVKKAKILQRESFILWNVKSAVFYTKQGETFKIYKSWNDININTRVEVKLNETLWKDLLNSILEDLNNFFESGVITDDVLVDILSVDAVIDVVLENISSTATNLKNITRRRSILDAEINKWWLSSASEYGFNPTSETDKQYKFNTLSKVILTDWVFKIIFANVIKRHFNNARAIENIKKGTTLENARAIIQTISDHCNFWNIFGSNLAIEYISSNAWSQIVQLNQFLSSINLEEIEIGILHRLLESSIASAKRKVAGQFATPNNLAELLTRLTIENKEGIVIDPCCGTGTIINQAYLLKEEYGIDQDAIINSVWASDKHSFPIQLSTLTMTKPNTIGKVLNIFRADVIDLKIGTPIKFKDPNNGNIIEKIFPCVDFVVSNLPFIKSKEIKVLNPRISSINQSIKNRTKSKIELSGKSDIFAFIPFYLHTILSENGKIGLVLSNAWLGTDYGELFLQLVQNYFDIEIVVISAKGKWFNNAEVVTTLFIASKRDPATGFDLQRKISFCTLMEKIDSIDDIKQLSDTILLCEDSENVVTQTYSINQIKQLEAIGIPWCGYFSDLSWLNTVSDKLIDCNKLFKFTRGERRGWNALFYPGPGHYIESDYIKPILKNLRGTPGLFCTTNKEAFCCSKSIKELQNLKHTGALSWIKSFESQNNETGVPLTKSLSKANMYWYEMKTDNMADFVANINYDRSLFIASFSNRSFIDQRMIGLSLKPEYQQLDKMLLLALLNSILSMFFIESYGFGRGLGALDLRETKFERDFKVLNPNFLNNSQKSKILAAFKPISQRNRFPLEQELEQADRINFESLLFKYYGISDYYSSVKKSLKHLYKIRFSVKD